MFNSANQKTLFRVQLNVWHHDKPQVRTLRNSIIANILSRSLATKCWKEVSLPCKLLEVLKINLTTLWTGDGVDYLNLALKDGGVTLTMNLGNGRLELQIKPNKVRFDDNQWHKVTVHRKVQEVGLICLFLFSFLSFSSSSYLFFFALSPFGFASFSPHTKRYTFFFFLFLLLLLILLLLLLLSFIPLRICLFQTTH